MEGWHRPHRPDLTEDSGRVCPPTDLVSVLGDLVLLRRHLGCGKSMAAIHTLGDGAIGRLQEDFLDQHGWKGQWDDAVTGAVRTDEHCARNSRGAWLPASVRERTVRRPTRTSLCWVTRAGRVKVILPWREPYVALRSTGSSPDPPKSEDPWGGAKGLLLRKGHEFRGINPPTIDIALPRDPSYDL